MVISDICIPLTEAVFFKVSQSVSTGLAEKIQYCAVKTGLFRELNEVDSARISTNIGSFSTVFLHEDLCFRYTPASTGSYFMNRALHVYAEVHKSCLGCKIWTYGELVSKYTSRIMGVVVVMARLYPLENGFSDEEGIYSELLKVNKTHFHNDLKLNNIMYGENTSIRLIDFDYMHVSSIIISVNSNETIVLDFGEFFKDKENEFPIFRTLYDYTTLSVSVDGDNPLYKKLLDRLVYLFNLIADTVLIPLAQWLPYEQLRDIPMEALVRCPGIEAVSVNVLDLRGNAFAHNVQNWERYPTLFKSNGVYWQDRR